MAIKRRAGGRPRAPKPGERFPVSFRVTPDLKARLDRAAEAHGLSQAQEAERRLARSFEREDLMLDALEAIYGAQLAGLVIMLADAMSTAATVSGNVEHEDGYPGRLAMRDWTRSAFAFNEVREGAYELLRLLAPEGETWPSQVADRRNKYEVGDERPGCFGKDAARQVLRLVLQPRGDRPMPLEDRIVEMLKPVLDRRAVEEKPE